METHIVIFLVITILVIIFLLLLYRTNSQSYSVFENKKEILETVTKADRGTRAEKKLVLKLLRYGIPAQTIFHDLYVKKRNGDFSQIDLVVATTAGIIVFEVKDYSGWIYGTGYKPQWTKVLAYGQQKYRFYNPILQNNKHIGDLRKQLKQFERIPFYSIVVFYGDCELKDITFVPDGTYVVREERVIEVLRIIDAKEPAPYTDKHEVLRVLREAVENGANKEVENRHIEKVTDMLGKHRVFD